MQQGELLQGLSQRSGLVSQATGRALGIPGNSRPGKSRERTLCVGLRTFENSEGGFLPVAMASWHKCGCEIKDLVSLNGVCEIFREEESPSTTLKMLLKSYIFLI